MLDQSEARIERVMLMFSFTDDVLPPCSTYRLELACASTWGLFLSTEYVERGSGFHCASERDSY
jgi:hypothetical protein